MLNQVMSVRRAACAALALGALSACQQPLDMDLRELGDGFSTTDAALSAVERPIPDDRGVISYPTYQVAVARQGDTVGTLAGRLGIDARTLASYNGLAPDAALRADEVVALPNRVAEPAPATAPATDLVGAASAAIDRAGPVTTTPLAPSAPTTASPAAPTIPSGAEPIRHQVVRGETAYSVARLYNVPVRTIAEWNGLGADLTVREGQFLLVPSPGTSTSAAAPLTAPGQGSRTPVPPSATAPLPDEQPVPTSQAQPEIEAAPQDLGAEQTQTSDAQLAMPVSGSIIRAYAPGRNEGIDIGAPAGTEVRAADAGTVAAITTNTDGIQIVVVKHANDLLTVYTHLENLKVAKDDRVSRGQALGQVKAGDPSFLHFEVRRGMASQDPTAFLP